MVVKQLPGTYAPDKSLYITLTDGAGNLVTPSGGGAGGTGTSSTTEVLYNSAGTVDGISGFTTNGTNTITGAAGTKLSLGGATIGTNNLAVTGNTELAGGVMFTTDNVYDIGSSGANRPKDIYAGNNVIPAGTGAVAFGATRSRITSPTNGNLIFSNQASNDFGMLVLGTTTAAYPAIQRQNDKIRLRLADDSGPAGLVALELTLTNHLRRGAPVTKTASFTVAESETFIIVNNTTGNTTVTLPTVANSTTGRDLHFKNLHATNTVISSGSNVVPKNSASAGTAILSGGAGAWCYMVFDGTNWVIMSSGT